MKSYKQKPISKKTVQKKENLLLPDSSEGKSWNSSVTVPQTPVDKKSVIAASKKLEIDEQGKQFEIKKFMTQELLDQLLKNENNIRESKKLKWDNVMKTASKIGMESEKDMNDHKDLLIDGLRAPPRWNIIEYVKSKQKYYWNIDTNEKVKANPDLINLRQEFLERKHNECIILDDITKEQLEEFVKGKDPEMLISNIEVNRDNEVDGYEGSSPFQVIKEMTQKIGMEQVDEIMKEKHLPILFRALNPLYNWRRAIFLRQGTIGYFNPKFFERSEEHPHLLKIKSEYLANRTVKNYTDIPDISKKQLQEYFDLDEEQTKNFDEKQLQRQQLIENAAKLIGLNEKEDMINYKDILIKLLQCPKPWKLIQYKKDQKFEYVNIKNDKTSKNHPLLPQLKKELAVRKQEFIREQEKIGEERILNLYESNFDREKQHNDIVVKKNQVILQKETDGVHWKVAHMEPLLYKDVVRRYSYFIRKMSIQGEMYIGMCEPEYVEENDFILDLKDPTEGTYLISANGRECYQKVYKDDPKSYVDYIERMEKEYKENPKTRFGFQEGDEIIVEVDLADRIITYENKRTKNKYTQKVRKIDDEFAMCAAMINPEDSIVIEPRSNFPIHFCLTWEHPEVDLDMHLTCACGNKISFQAKRCRMCLTYLDKDHVTGEDPIEHIFIRNLPKSGQLWKYGVHYYEDHTEDKSAKNIPYSVSVISVDEKENYTTLQRKDGVIRHEDDSTYFDFTYDSSVDNKIKENNKKLEQKILQIKA